MVEKPVNEKRRNILKLALFGSGAFVLGKVFGPSINFFSGDYGLDGKVFGFKNFRVVESSQGISFYDKLGNEILVLEKD